MSQGLVTAIIPTIAVSAKLKVMDCNTIDIKSPLFMLFTI